MAIINYDGISGINSITSVGSGVQFYNTTGASSFTITPSGTGNASFGQALSISDLSWAKDTYQQVYSFSGTTGGSTSSPADGCLLLGNPNANPSATRVGTIVFGNKVSGTSVTGNPGIKAVIESTTNTNVANAADTGGSLRFYTKPDNGELAVRMTIDSAGRMRIPSQPHIFGSIGNNTTQNNSFASYMTIFSSTELTFSNSRITVPVAGNYLITFTTISDNVTARRDSNIYLNGTSRLAMLTDDTSAGYKYRSGSLVAKLAANDYIQFYNQNWYDYTQTAYIDWRTASVTLLG
jgi:hypothetical protein